MSITSCVYTDHPDFKRLTEKKWVIYGKDVDYYRHCLEIIVFREHQLKCVEEGYQMSDIDTPTDFFGCTDYDDYLNILSKSADLELEVYTTEGYNALTKCDIFRIATIHYYG